MRIAVLSNCQGESLSLCINAMNSSIHADFFLSSDVENGKFDLDNILNNYDQILVQPGTSKLVPAEYNKKKVLFPSIIFSGYHPDITFLRAKNHQGELCVVNGPMSSYNSAIAIFGYYYGIGLDDIVGHYNPYVYSKFGYFEHWSQSRKELIIEGELAQFPLGALFKKWVRSGIFMHSFNHPTLSVMADIGRGVLAKMKIPIERQNILPFLVDPLANMPVWPVYPEIAAKKNVEGDYVFNMKHTNSVMGLREFVEKSYLIYQQFDKSTFEPFSFSIDDFARKLYQKNTVQIKNPYLDANKYQFWKNAVASVAPQNLDPVVNPKFIVLKENKVATAGSCFAQHIAKTLSASGFDYYVAESAPPNISIDEANNENYGVFSARYGNIYTVRQMLQLIHRVYGLFVPQDTVWKRSDGKFVDPFRPQISQRGFENSLEVLAAREEHFSAVREMLEKMHVLIFTLGLTEGWRSKFDGAVFPLAPGVAGGEVDFVRYEFVNFDVDEIAEDLDKVVDFIKAINPQCKIILTVSPVPLIATYEDRHALVATTYSKSVLRTVAETISKERDNVEYFPSYEIITGSFNGGKYYNSDCRTVTEDGVSHVMRVFMKNYAGDHKTLEVTKSSFNDSGITKRTFMYDIVCDEEAIVSFDRDGI
jgi:hypothetical protein